MKTLFVLREQLKEYYSRFDIYLIPVLKFILAFVTFSLINSKLGYMTRLDQGALVLILALACSFLPINLIMLLAAVFVLMHLYALSMEVAVVTLVIFLILFLLYFRFSPKDGIIVLLTPLCFALNIPYVIPISMGLIGTPASVISVICGVFVRYILSYISGNVQTLDSLDAESEMQKFRFVIDGLINNNDMFMVMFAFSITLIVVYFIRRLSVDYSWTIASITGLLTNIVLLLAGDLILDTNISIGLMLLRSVISLVIVFILQFIVFNVDYTRTENVQFEDDEYYYYVKAIPKNVISKAEKTVKKINTPQKKNTKPISESNDTKNRDLSNMSRRDLVESGKDAVREAEKRNIEFTEI